MKAIPTKKGSDILLHPSWESGAVNAFFNYLELSVEYNNRVPEQKMLFPKTIIGAQKAESAASIVSSILQFADRVVPLRPSSNKTKQPLRRNVIDVSPMLAEELGLFNNQMAYLAFGCTLFVAEVTVLIDPTIDERDEVRLPNDFKEHYSDGKDVLFISPKKVLAKTIKRQMAVDIKKDIITIDQESFRLVNQPNVQYLRLRHIGTGATISRQMTQVEYNSNLKQESICLNYYQRESLNILDIGKAGVDNNRIKMMCDKVKRTNASYASFFNLQDKVIAPTEAYNWIQLMPGFQKVKSMPLSMHICNWLAGGCSMNLSAIRPYKIDDSRDVVRLSEDTMTLLGIQETDSVIIKYGNRTKKAIAMKIDSLELMAETNIITTVTDLDRVVGIPAPMRQELGLGDIETEVVVVRDTPFLVRKNLNIQTISVLGLFLAVFQIGEGHVLEKLAVCLGLLPLVLLLSLSQERSKVSRGYNKHSR